MVNRGLLWACMILMGASPAVAGSDWRSLITPADQSRLDRMAHAISEGDSLARQSDPRPTTADLDRLAREMKAAPLPINIGDLPGT